MDYGEFRKQYESQHPASVPVYQEPVSDYPWWLEWLSLLMFLAVSVVSGVHTVSTMRYTMIASMVIPEHLKDIAAGAAFFGFEVALFVSVFGWLRKENRWIAYLATAVVFLVIVLANIQDVSRAVGDDAFNGVMIFGIGIGTPLVALFSGKLFVDIYRRKLVNLQLAKQEFAEALKQWDAIINREYAKWTKQVSGGHVRADGQRTDKQAASGYGYNRSSDAQDKVRRYLEENPEAFDMSVRALADHLGVGKSTVADVRRLMQPVSTNGNGHAQ